MGVVTQVMCMCVTYIEERYHGVGARGGLLEKRP